MFNSHEAKVKVNEVKEMCAAGKLYDGVRNSFKMKLMIIAYVCAFENVAILQFLCEIS